MLTHIHAHTESEEDEKHFMFSISLDIYEYDSNNSIESNIGNTRAYTLLPVMLFYLVQQHVFKTTERPSQY